MSVRRLDPNQPEDFVFTAENLAWAQTQIAKYPAGRQASAILPLLWQAQKQAGGWLPEPAIRYVAELLEMPHVRAYEIATFYTMFNLSPVGENYVQLCGTTPCMLQGAEGLKEVCRKRIGPEGQMSADGKFSWLEVECLGACVNAPMVQINDDYYEDLTPESFEAILDALAEGREVATGTHVDRQFSAPVGGLTTLSDPSLYDGSAGGWRGKGNLAELQGRAAASDMDEHSPLAESGAKFEKGAAESPTAGEASAAVNAAQQSAAGAAGSTPDSESAEAAAEAAADDPEAKARADAAGSQPPAHDPVDATEQDDLKRISGVGPKIEGILHRLGIYTFAQIAAWTPENVAWVDNYLSFKGRIGREDWIAQAKDLSAGASTGSDK